MTYDAFFKQLFRELFSNITMSQNVSVGALPLSIDLVIRPKPEGSFKYLNWFFLKLDSENIIEYKSGRDKSHPQDLSKMMGYLGLYANKNALTLDFVHDHCTLWYISVNKSKFFTKMIEKQEILSEKIPGLYQIHLPFICPFYCLFINEMEINTENLPLLLLSTGETYRQTIKLLKNHRIEIDPIVKKYLIMNYYINYRDVNQMGEILEIWPEDVKINVKMAVEHIGIKKTIEAVGLKEVIDTVGLKEVIDTVGLKEVIDTVGLKEVIDTVGLKEVIDTVGLKEILNLYSKSEINAILKEMDKT